jgi:hypothetical protein
VQLSNEAILSKTHYGLNIYAHVLRQYHPGKTVLSLSGRDCQPVANPFNDNKPTLHISMVGNCAIHQDAELPGFEGDAFDFAAHHYGLKGEDLFKKLNEAMHLHIGEPYTFYTRRIQPVQQVQQVSEKVSAPVFSYFHAPVSNTVPARSITLIEVYELVKGKKFASQTATLRRIADKKQAKAYKAANFNYVTFSGIFSTRADKALQKHSGLLTIDLDHIGDPSEWRVKLLADEYFETELLFASPSGDGLKWILSIDLAKATHLDYFKSISNYMFQTYGLAIDQTGKDCSRACFLPHDPKIYINKKYLE